MTSYEIAGRNKKAATIAAILRKGGVSASVARLADDADWDLAYKAAGVRPSKPETKHLTRDLVIKALERACRCDAFGLPGCVLDLEEPPCGCDGPYPCDLHADDSRYRRALAAHDAEGPATKEPPPIMWGKEEECPF